jgi:hypothetical protein
MPAALFIDLGLLGSGAAVFIPNNQYVFHENRSGLDSAFVLYKRSAEYLPVDFDLSSVLPAGSTVFKVLALTCDQANGPTMTTPVISTQPTTYTDSGTTVVAGCVVQFTCGGGLSQLPPAASLAPYIIRLIYQSLDGATREAIGYLAVVDQPPVGIELP